MSAVFRAQLDDARRRGSRAVARQRAEGQSHRPSFRWIDELWHDVRQAERRSDAHPAVRQQERAPPVQESHRVALELRSRGSLSGLAADG